MSDNIVTIFSDASFKDGFAGYAYWIKFDSETTIKYSQACSYKCDNIGDVETIALCMAIKRALHERENLIIVAQSDSKDALETFIKYGAIQAKTSDIKLYRSNYRGKLRENLVQLTMEKVKSTNSTLYLKHIRSHKGISSPRSAVNTWCDKAAGKARIRAEQIQRI